MKRALWLLLAVPGLAQVGLLLYTVARRFAYPYDLEWMEGGMLVHAWRLMHGETIYPAPSVEFIPYLYTPGYPALLAGLGKVFGLTYALGRAVSVVSLVAVLALAAYAVLRSSLGTRPAAATRREGDGDASAAGFGGSDDRASAAISSRAESPPRRRASTDSCDRGPVTAGAGLAMGLFAAVYPWVEGWYDLVRGDTLFLAVALGGLILLWRGARQPRLVAGAAALLALSFFIKQTGVLLCAAGGAALVVLNWRAVPIYAAVAGVIGGGGTLLLNRLTDGWFWLYVFQMHQQHDTNMPRFWKSFVNMLGHFPALTATVALALVAVIVHLARSRRLLPGATGFLYWLWMLACGMVMGALGWATQWAHFNAYIPAMTFGAIAAGAAIGVLAGSLQGRLGPAAAAIVAAGLGVQLALAWWSPRPLLPTAASRAAGDRLIQRLASYPGDVFIPSHPFYAVMAGKSPHTHRMGILDVTVVAPGKKPLSARAHQVAGLEEGLRQGRFAAVIVDDRSGDQELPGLNDGYRLEERLPPDERPRVVSGAATTPLTAWIPQKPAVPPPGARVIDDFESGTLAAWRVEGNAWAASRGRPRDAGGYGGRWFASSSGGGDKPMGTLSTPPFVITGGKIMFRLGGGNDANARAELRLDDGAVARRATNTKRTTVLQPVEWDVGDLRGRTVTLAFVDGSAAEWGWLMVDDVWEVP